MFYRSVGRLLRCDHVEKYRLPKEVREREESILDTNPSAEISIGPGHAYKDKDLANTYNISNGIDLWSSEPSMSSKKRKKYDSFEEENYMNQIQKVDLEKIVVSEKKVVSNVVKFPLPEIKDPKLGNLHMIIRFIIQFS